MRFSFFVFAFLFINTISTAQDVQLFTEKIQEERHSNADESYIEISAKLLGIKVDENNQIKIDQIISAEDNTGRQLNQKESFFGNKFDDSETVKIRLEAPARAANQITKVEGIILQYSPSESNKSKVVIKNSAQNQNKNILEGKSTEVKLTLLNQKSLVDLESKNAAEYQEKITALKEAGVLTDELSEGIDGLKGALEEFMKFGIDDEKTIAFHVEDPNDKLIEVNIYDENGKKQSNGYSRMNNMLQKSCRKSPQENWTIEVLLENDAAMKKLKFTLNNVPLP